MFGGISSSIRIVWRTQASDGLVAGKHSQFPLQQLDCNTSTVWVRSQAFNSGFILFFVVAIFTWVIWGGHIAQDMAWPLLWLPEVIGVVGFIMMIASVKPIEFVCFHAMERRDVLLMVVGRAGPDRDQLDDFVAAVKLAIALNQTVSAKLVSPAAVAKSG